jgi:hypothetical protein
MSGAITVFKRPRRAVVAWMSVLVVRAGVAPVPNQQSGAMPRPSTTASCAQQCPPLPSRMSTKAWRATSSDAKAPTRSPMPPDGAGDEPANKR